MQPGQPSSLPGRTKLQATTAMHMMFSSTCTQVGREDEYYSVTNIRQFGWDQWSVPPLVKIVFCGSIIRHTNQFEWVSIPVDIDVFDVIEVNYTCTCRNIT